MAKMPIGTDVELQDDVGTVIRYSPDDRIATVASLWDNSIHEVRVQDLRPARRKTAKPEPAAQAISLWLLGQDRDTIETDLASLHGSKAAAVALHKLDAHVASLAAEQPVQPGDRVMIRVQGKAVVGTVQAHAPNQNVLVNWGNGRTGTVKVASLDQDFTDLAHTIQEVDDAVQWLDRIAATVGKPRADGWWYRLTGAVVPTTTWVPAASPWESLAQTLVSLDAAAAEVMKAPAFQPGEDPGLVPEIEAYRSRDIRSVLAALRDKFAVALDRIAEIAAQDQELDEAPRLTAGLGLLGRLRHYSAQADGPADVAALNRTVEFAQDLAQHADQFLSDLDTTLSNATGA